MERDRPGAGVCHGVGEQEYLDLLFGEAAAMNLLEQRDEATDEHGRRGHHPGDVGDHAEGSLQRPQRRLGLLGRGIERVHTGKKRQFLEAWFVQLLDTVAEVLPFGVEAAMAASQLEADARRRGRSIETRDLFILAIAKARRLPLATRNVSHFRGHGVEVYDPFTGSAVH